MLEGIYADAFVYRVLAADVQLVAALGGEHIYNGLAPQGTAPPYVLYSVMASEDVNSGNKSERLMVLFLYQVAVIGKTVNGVLQSAPAVREASHRVDEVLRKIEGRAFTLEGVTLNFNVRRERALVRETPGLTADVAFRHIGGLYRCEAFNAGGGL